MQPVHSRRGVWDPQTNRELGNVRNGTNKTYSLRGETTWLTTQKRCGQGGDAELTLGDNVAVFLHKEVEGVPLHSCT